MQSTSDYLQQWLARVIRRENCVLSYDRSLLSQLPDILLEQYAIHDVASLLVHWPDLRWPLEQTIGSPMAAFELKHLPAALVAAGINEDDYSTRVNYPMADAFSSWTESTAEDSNGAADVLALHGQLGSGNFGLESRPYDSEIELENLSDYLRRVTPAPFPRPSLPRRALNRLRGRPTLWGTWIPRWQRMGYLEPDVPSLSIGPRWTTEIRYFRDVLGLRAHRGLDLFSSDPDLVDVGDMHEMPYGDSSFQLVFVKNTLDKSYDIRRAVAECCRVLKPGGILVVDQVCAYGWNTPLTRTDIQGVRPLTYLTTVRGFSQPLVEKTTQILPEPAPWAAPTRNLVQVALQKTT